ncbi:MAG: hypothetical protein QW330_01340, partial [Nitrososphaerota archaeon]
VDDPGLDHVLDLLRLDVQALTRLRRADLVDDDGALKARVLRELAKRLLENSWSILEYLVSSYSDRVYIGAGFAYNPAWMTLEEVAEIGDRIASIDPDLQVTVLDYFPAFRRRDIRRPTASMMLEVKKVLEERGLKTVIVQTGIGHIGPGDRIVHY